MENILDKVVEQLNQDNDRTSTDDKIDEAIDVLLAGNEDTFTTCNALTDAIAQAMHERYKSGLKAGMKLMRAVMN